MSIMIKGMTMPSCCDACPLFDNMIDGICSITHTDYHHAFPLHSRMPDCPLIEVPPHGRLIDADALTNFQMSGKVSSADGSDWGRQTWIVLPHYSSLNEIPTVLEADYE